MDGWGYVSEDFTGKEMVMMTRKRTNVMIPSSFIYLLLPSYFDLTAFLLLNKTHIIMHA